MERITASSLKKKSDEFNSFKNKLNKILYILDDRAEIGATFFRATFTEVDEIKEELRARGFKVRRFAQSDNTETTNIFW